LKIFNKIIVRYPVQYYMYCRNQVQFVITKLLGKTI